jgi:hypothetical protein
MASEKKLAETPTTVTVIIKPQIVLRLLTALSYRFTSSPHKNTALG